MDSMEKSQTTRAGGLCRNTRITPARSGVLVATSAYARHRLTARQPPGELATSPARNPHDIPILLSLGPRHCWRGRRGPGPAHASHGRLGQYRDRGPGHRAPEGDAVPRAALYGSEIRGLLAEVVRLCAAGRVPGAVAEGGARGGLLSRGGAAIRSDGDAVDRRRQRLLRGDRRTVAHERARPAHRARPDRVRGDVSFGVAGQGG